MIRMPEPPNNVVLTRAAAQALRLEFIGWQCRVRQLAAREQGGRPTSGMCPRVSSDQQQTLSNGIVTLLVESEPEHSTTQFRFEYLKTQDPHERYDKALQILQAGYFQEPRRFSDVLTALFGHDATLAGKLLELRRCVLEFEQFTQGYRLPCSVARLPATHRLYQATYWHNSLFNPHLPADVDILSFTPDWTHAMSFRRT
jgi:hypothetical protein